MVDSTMAAAATTDKHPIEVHVYDASQGKYESLQLTFTYRPRCTLHSDSCDQSQGYKFDVLIVSTCSLDYAAAIHILP